MSRVRGVGATRVAVAFIAISMTVFAVYAAYLVVGFFNQWSLPSLGAANLVLLVMLAPALMGMFYIRNWRPKREITGRQFMDNPINIPRALRSKNEEQ